MRTEIDGRVFPRPTHPENGGGYEREILAIPQVDVVESWHNLSSKLSYIQQQDPIAFQEIAQAFYFSYLYHDRLSTDPEDRLRKDGSHYMTHPAAVAGVLTEYELDADTILAALLHDTREDTVMDVGTMEALFGNTVTKLVEGVSKITGNKTKKEDAAETLKKKYRALLTPEEEGDPRIVLIKLADRLHNLRTIGSLDSFRQKAIATETILHFVPLARILGMTDLQNELEELSYTLLVPEDAYTASLLQQETVRNISLQKDTIIDLYQSVLTNASIPATISISFPTFSNYHRYVGTESADTHANAQTALFHINIESYGQNTLEEVTETLKPITTMLRGTVREDPEYDSQEIYGQDFSIRICTPYAFAVRNYNVARSYQQGVRRNGWENNDLYHLHHGKLSPIRRNIRQVMALENAQDIIAHLSDDFSEKLTYVYSPDNEIVSLPEGSTVADYAALIPGEFLITASGAEVNSKAVPLDYVLQKQDRVSIRTARQLNPDVISFTMADTVRRYGTKKRIFDSLSDIIRLKEVLPENISEWPKHTKFSDRLRWFGYRHPHTKDGAEKLISLVDARFKEAKSRSAAQFIDLYNDKRKQASPTGFTPRNPYIHPEHIWPLLPESLRNSYSSLDFFYAYAACQQVPVEHLETFIEEVIAYEEKNLKSWSALFPDEPGIIASLTQIIGPYNIANLDVGNTFETGGWAQVDLVIDTLGFPKEKMDALLFNLFAYTSAIKGRIITPTRGQHTHLLDSQ